MKGSLLLPFLIFAQFACGQGKVMICVSPTAHAYHSGYCQGLNACTHTIEKITLKEAKDLGKDPCGYCYKGSAKGVVSKATASGQCMAITKKGTRCSRASRTGGFCWQHGG